MGLDADDAIGWIGLEGDIDELGRIVVPEREDRDQHRRVESDGRNRLQDLEQEGEPPRSGPKRIAGKSTCGRETTRPPKRYQNHPWPAGHSFFGCARIARVVGMSYSLRLGGPGFELYEITRPEFERP